MTRKPMVVFLLVAIVVIALLAAFAWGMQDRLIFYPQPLSPYVTLPKEVTPCEVVAGDGSVLRGWMRRADATPAPTVLYFGGNAEEVSWTMSERRWPSNWNVVAINYRGYGASEGSPSERALVDDAQAIYAAVAARGDVAGGRIVAFGRSLGTGVAVQLAAHKPLAGVVLVSPYDSLLALGRLHYPLLPARWVLRHRFASEERAPTIHAPMLALVADNDAIIPAANSRALYDAWAGPKLWLSVPNTDHGTVAMPDAFWTAVARFLAERA